MANTSSSYRRRRLRGIPKYRLFIEARVKAIDLVLRKMIHLVLWPSRHAVQALLEEHHLLTYCRLLGPSIRCRLRRFCF